jgi:23S rRNA (uracil1939-C5)-methyltransferase
MRKKPTPKKITVTIEKLVFGGQGIATCGGKKIFVWNALPGEEVRAIVYKSKRSYSEAVAVEIISPSTERRAHREEHFLSCSPWQIMTSAYEAEWKKKIALEMYAHIGLIDSIEDIQWYNDPAYSYGYRNKMEYSFTESETGKGLSLAFFERGRHCKRPIPDCELAIPALNDAARFICSWLNKHSFPRRSLKSLVLRANEESEVIAALFIKDKVSVLKMPALNECFKGFSIYYSDPRSPASRPDELLRKCGDDTITTDIDNTILRYGLHSFFQINLLAFRSVLTDIKKFLDPAKPLVDFYAGVGALSIPLKDYFSKCTAVEINAEAVMYATDNARINGLTDYFVHQASTEKALEYITPEATILFDPPRAGLHTKIISRLLNEKPSQILYMSCNISTQARDIQALLAIYRPVFIKLYNFFPHTPHIESVCILKLK